MTTQNHTPSRPNRWVYHGLEECPTCNGIGERYARIECSVCAGTGECENCHRNCRACAGRGYIIVATERCPTCNGELQTHCYEERDPHGLTVRFVYRPASQPLDIDTQTLELPYALD